MYHLNNLGVDGLVAAGVWQDDKKQRA